jgi:hypothetical protein
MIEDRTANDHDVPRVKLLAMKVRSSVREALVVLILVIGGGCATSRATPPAVTELPSFAFAGLRGSPVTVMVLDQRPGERDPEWTRRITADVTQALSASGAIVRPGSSTVLEVRLLKARSDFEDRQWNGCVELSGRLSNGMTSSGEACVAKANLWGVATADNVLRLAYADALVKLLSALDAQL